MELPQTASYALHATMYMVRHLTQLPVTAATIAKGEGIPLEAVTDLVDRLVQNGIIKASPEKPDSYVFAKQPESINLLELFESALEKPLFPPCLLHECRCGGTPQTCVIKGIWCETIEQLRRKLADTNLVSATWHHPVHSLDENRSNTITAVDDPATTRGIKSRANGRG